jgi:hydrogenase maturation protease
VLVVGVGSELRRDDGAGRHVAETIARVAPAGVESRSVHQLAPELAVELVGRRLVLIVDAAVDVTEVTVRSVELVAAEAGGTGVMTHHLDPAALVGLAALFGPPPDEVVVVSLPVRDLGIGTGLSSWALEAADRAALDVLERCSHALAGEGTSVA